MIAQGSSAAAAADGPFPSHARFEAHPRASQQVFVFSPSGRYAGSDALALSIATRLH